MGLCKIGPGGPVQGREEEKIVRVRFGAQVRPHPCTGGGSQRTIPPAFHWRSCPTTRAYRAQRSPSLRSCSTAFRAACRSGPRFRWGGGILGRKPFQRALEGPEARPEPELVCCINWADSGPGYSWPESYYVTYLPGLEKYIVTASLDSPDVWGLRRPSDRLLRSRLHARRGRARHRHRALAGGVRELRP